MKILGINSSPSGKKSQTLRLVNAVLNGAKSRGAEAEFVDLYKLTIEYCIGCRKCFETGACIFQDDYPELLQKMLESDGMVWGSPNYSYGVNAPMKAMIDRMADMIHCQYFDGKYCCAVCTAGRDDKVITQYLTTNFLDLGAYVTGTVGVVVTKGPQEVDAAEALAFKLGVALVSDIESQRPYFDQRVAIDANRREFQRKVRQYKDQWKYQYAYWEQQNWR